MFNQASISGARPCGEGDVESRRAVRLLGLERQTMVDFSPAESRRLLSRTLWRSASGDYGGRMQSRRGCEEETEDIHEMDYQKMASLRRFPGVV